MIVTGYRYFKDADAVLLLKYVLNIYYFTNKFQKMKKISLITLFILPFMVLIFSSCKKQNDVNEERVSVKNDLQTFAAPNITSNANSELLKSVRAATAKYHSVKQAISAGYLPTSQCVSVPGMGGMGYHYANPNLVDPVFDPLKPEAVLYAPGEGGKLKLVAVEYIVINTGQAAPVFGSQPFMVGGTPVPVPHWSLHVWLYEENPNGIFIPFNPHVSCQ